MKAWLIFIFFFFSVAHSFEFAAKAFSDSAAKAFSGATAKAFSSGEAAQLERLKVLGYKKNIRIYLRIFKEEKLLEVWVKSSQNYKMYKSFDICNYSGKLGPKLKEGDHQAPEGFYHVPASDVQWNSVKWPRALNLSFPNIFDALKKRTGSYLLIHGGCSSVGCYALENGPMATLYDLVAVAIHQGQTLFPIHIFPFRMTKANKKRHKANKWSSFWQSMQPVYDHFNATRELPTILVCQTGYQIYRSRRYEELVGLVRRHCLHPLPIISQSLPIGKGLSWVAKLKEDYKKYKLLARRNGRGTGASIKISCNLKRPSCKKWLAMRKRMLKRGNLPKALLIK